MQSVLFAYDNLSGDHKHPVASSPTTIAPRKIGCIDPRHSLVGTAASIGDNAGAVTVGAGVGFEEEISEEVARVPGISDRGRPYTYQRSVSTPNPTDPPSTLPSSSRLNANKHTRDSVNDSLANVEQPVAKKRRLRHRVHPTLDPTQVSNLPQNLVENQIPPSPLFFSHRSRDRPTLPQFSSYEAAIKMMNCAQQEDVSGVTTVRMARGVVPSNTSPRGSSISSQRESADRFSLPRVTTPEEHKFAQALQSLTRSGIVELLDQDDRPTFVIDLAEQANFSGCIRVLFANVSLRSINGLIELVSGRFAEEPSLSHNFDEYRSWATSFVRNNEVLDTCLPSMAFAGTIWTCSTLQKRFRVIAGGLPSSSTSALSSNPPSVEVSQSATLVGLASKEKRKASKDSVTLVLEEPSDYFGNILSFAARSPGKGSMSQVMPTVETPRYSPRSQPSKNNATKGKRGSASPQAQGIEEIAIPITPLGGRANEAQIKAASAGSVDAFESPEHYEQGFFDWTRIPVTPLMPRHIRFARSIKWEETSLGPIEDWPTALRGIANLVMASPHPAAMYWGDDLVAIYNEAYVMLAGQKHPELMGQPYHEAWSEIWEEIKDVFVQARLTGQATMKDDDRIFMKRRGFLEETYFTWSVIPLVGADGSVQGMYNPAFEKTRRTLAERRMLTLREVGEQTAAAREVRAFWSKVLKGLEINEYDAPFVLLYSTGEEYESDAASSVCSVSNAGPRICRLEGALGVPSGHPAAPDSVDFRSGNEGFVRYFREAMIKDQAILLETSRGTLDPKLLDGLIRRGFDDPCTAAVVTPIHPTSGESTLGFLVMGINPRRPFDDDYSLFVQLLSRQLTTSMASVVLFEEEIRRGQKAAKLAAQDRIELSEQLAARTQEAVESETKFTRMAEFAPVGMFIANARGEITYSNDTWFDISRHPKEENSMDTWMDSVKDDDRDKVRNLWKRLIEDKEPISNEEFRFKTPWTNHNDVQGETWVLANAYPERNSDGTLKSAFGSITDISQQKWAANLEKQRTEEAMEHKRQQENFIDTTSHEIRNPLSAILQCADEIVNSLADAKASGETISRDTLDSNITAAQTIVLCANHQKRIVDDVLTLSKLDSALLLVTPIDCQPSIIMQRVAKMFGGEAQTHDIQMQYNIDDSIQKLRVDWVKLDPSRLLQVLINLTTNAIKFTSTQAKRVITVTLSALEGRPSPTTLDDTSRVSYFPSRSKAKDLTEGHDWGEGQPVFLHFAVRDTGRGLDGSEKKLLFLRFSQASPRTHVQYGGSGLGLFISRELVELQGGEIGVASEAGVGSTFAFYVKARRSSAPLEQIQLAGEARRTQLSEMAKSNPRTKLARRGVSEKPPQATSNLKVMIVEDNLVNQRVLQRQLKNAGCTVYVANHGIECIEKLKESTYWRNHSKDAIEVGVILMDLEMPLMDGLTCARTIRELQKTGELLRHVPIIAVTANARSEQINTALGAGMDDVVSKPFRIPELIPKIEELLESRRSL